MTLKGSNYYSHGWKPEVLAKEYLVLAEFLLFRKNCDKTVVCETSVLNKKSRHCFLLFAAYFLPVHYDTSSIIG